MVFGWPGPILAIVLAIVGVARGRIGWLVAAAMVLAPFSFYLLLTPRFWWGVFLPVLPLTAAGAISRNAGGVAWAAALLLAAVVLGLAGLLSI
jgi:hypothetical protein